MREHTPLASLNSGVSVLRNACATAFETLSGPEPVCWKFHPAPDPFQSKCEVNLPAELVGDYVANCRVLAGRLKKIGESDSKGRAQRGAVPRHEYRLVRRWGRHAGSPTRQKLLAIQPMTQVTL